MDLPSRPDAASDAAPAATLSNWRELPFNRSAFQNVAALIPTAAIAHSPGDVWQLPATPRAFDAFSVRAPGGAVLDFERFLDATATDALVIVHDGAIVCERYFNGMTETTPHIIMSASKSITGLIAGILGDRGTLDLEAEVTTLIPEVAATAYQGATLRQMLDMRTGIALDLEAQRNYLASTGWDAPRPGQPAGELRHFYQTLAIKPAPHGGPFRYVSANSDLLGWAIERASGTRFADLVSELLWRPLGAERPASITLTPDHLARTTGGFSMIARDFARLGQLMLLHGARDGRAIVPASWIDDLWTGGDRQAWKAGEWGRMFGAQQMSYRGGWYVVDGAPRTMFAMGIHGQNLFVDPEHRLVIAKLSSQGAAVDTTASATTHWALPGLRRCLAALS